MKKNLWYLLLAVCSLNLFISCGDDDDPEPNPTPDPTPTPTEEIDWKEDMVGEYGNSYISLNGAAAVSGKSIALGGDSESSAVITIKNIVPEAASVEFKDVEMKSTGSAYTFSAQQEVNETLISIEGTITTPSKTKASMVATESIIDMKVSRKINSDVAGAWSLKLTEPTYGVMMDVETGNPQADAMINGIFPAMIGQMIADKVKDVNISLGQDGSFDVSWVKADGDDPTTIPAEVATGIDMCYFVENDTYYMALGKKASLMGLAELDVKDFAAMFLGEKLPEGALDALFDLLIEDRGTDKGGYYAIPMNYALESNEATFYLGGDKLLPLMKYLTPMLSGLIPEGQEAIAGPLLEALASAQDMNFGLVLTR